MNQIAKLLFMAVCCVYALPYNASAAIMSVRVSTADPGGQDLRTAGFSSDPTTELEPYQTAARIRGSQGTYAVAKFNLTGYDKSKIRNPVLNMYAALTSNRQYDVYAVNYWTLAKAFNNELNINSSEGWKESNVEGATLASVPGLIPAVDGQGPRFWIDPLTTTEIGTGLGTDPMVIPAVETSYAVVTNNNVLENFIQNYPGNFITLIFWANNTQNIFFNDFERADDPLTLDVDETVMKGAYAPFLTFELVPEPTSSCLLGTSIICLFACRKRG